MREIYIKSIESGALDKALSGWAGDDYPTPGREFTTNYSCFGDSCACTRHSVTRSRR